MAPQPELIHVARAMFECALEDGAAQLELNSTAMAARLRQGNCYECDPLRYFLARQVADYLAITDPNLRAFYQYDPALAAGDSEEIRSGPSPASSMNLLAWTAARNPDLYDKISALSTAFDEARRGLLCPGANGLCFHLNVEVVDDDDVRARRGYAALLASHTASPNRIWSCG